MTGNSSHPGEEQLALFLYGDADESAGIASHLEACGSCRAELAALERTLALADRHRVPGRDEAYGGVVWARVQQQLHREPPRTWMASLTPRRLLLAGGLAVLLVAAFIAGRYSRSPQPAQVAHGGPAATPPPVKDASSGQVRDRVLLVAVGDHLERSQMILVELMNRPVDGSVDISGTQEWARDLVPTNRLIRQTADEAGEPVVADVLGDLERVLVEIANSPSPLSGAEFERVRERIESQGLVFKIRVLDSQVRERERAAFHNASTRS